MCYILYICIYINKYIYILKKINVIQIYLHMVDEWMDMYVKICYRENSKQMNVVVVPWNIWPTDVIYFTTNTRNIIKNLFCKVPTNGFI